MKKLLFLGCIFLIMIGLSTDVYASATVGARIGNKYFDTLKEAVSAASSTDIIILASNMTLDETLEIKKNVNIDLNNHNISGEEKVFLIQGGSLNLSGNGKIIETKPNYGTITLIGSSDPSKKDFSTVSVGSGITLEGWSGIFITHNNNKSYGVLVNMNGVINALDDINGGAGAGIYVNGNIKHEDNSPIINLGKTSKITSTGNGIYSAGFATYTINGAYISGVESGLGIKAGVFNIIDGTIIGTGEDKTPTSGNNNGINASGTAIQIESNKGYAGNVGLTIKNGTIESRHSNVIYEYVVNKANTQVKDISISGGRFVSNAGKPVLSLSDSFTSTHQGFITGGQFSSNPNNFLKAGYSTYVNENSLYEVISSTMNVFGDSGGVINNPISIILIILLIGGLGITVYLNSSKILDFINTKIKR